MNSAVLEDYKKFHMAEVQNARSMSPDKAGLVRLSFTFKLFATIGLLSPTGLQDPR